MKETQIKQYLENLSFVISQQDQPEDSLAFRIFKRLVGTTRTSRLGPFPESDVVETVCGNIGEKIRNGEPIQIVSAWGAKKTLPGANQQVDIVEFFTLLQFLAISKEIQSIYPPGAECKLFIGNAFYEYLYGKHADLPTYLSRMRTLCEMVGPDIFKIVSMEEFHKEDKDLFARCDANFQLLANYWEESSRTPEEKWCQLDSQKALHENGWIGAISPSMREHYLKRLDQLFPHFSQEEKISSVLRFFAYGMMVNQKDLFGRKNPDLCTVDFCLLRTPPPGMPKLLHGNRLRKRIIPEKLSKKTAPPWTVKGMLFHDKEADTLKPLLISHADETKDFVKNVVDVDLFDIFNVSIEVVG